MEGSNVCVCYVTAEARFLFSGGEFFFLRRLAAADEGAQCGG